MAKLGGVGKPECGRVADSTLARARGRLVCPVATEVSQSIRVLALILMTSCVSKRGPYTQNVVRMQKTR
jgi:hypothetical protein